MCDFKGFQVFRFFTNISFMLNGSNPRMPRPSCRRSFSFCTNYTQVKIFIFHRNFSFTDLTFFKTYSGSTRPDIKQNPSKIQKKWTGWKAVKNIHFQVQGNPKRRRLCTLFSHFPHFSVFFFDMYAQNWYFWQVHQHQSKIKWKDWNFSPFFVFKVVRLYKLDKCPKCIKIIHIGATYPWTANFDYFTIWNTLIF